MGTGINNIMALINNMTTPNTIITNLDVTGMWGDVTIYGIIIVSILATGYWYRRFSERVAVGTFIGFVLAVLLYVADLVTVTGFFRSLVLMVLGVIYLWSDKNVISPQ